MKALKLYAVGYLVFLYAPILLLPLFAFNDARVISFPLSGFTTHWFTEMTKIPALYAAFKNSLTIALCAALISTILGIFAARAATRFSFAGKGPIMGLIMLPLVLPDVIVAISLLVVLLQLGIALQTWTVIMGHVLICLPFSIAILNAAFQALDRSLEEAAIDLGETRVSTFRLVILPLVMPGIISSLLIAFTISFDEFIVSYFLTGSSPTLPVYIYGQFRYPAKVPVIMALGTLLVLGSFVLLSIAEYFRRRGIKRRGGQDTGGFL
jgi:spermidine/putrescine transport system permease protein